MRSSYSGVFKAMLVLILSVVLAGTCLLCAGDAFADCREEGFSFQSDSMQRQRVRTAAAAEELESFAETLRSRTEEEISDRIFTRMLRPVFQGLILAGLSNHITRGFLCESEKYHSPDTIVIDYIHSIDGKIKHFGLSVILK
ncbi:MAG: hypothetical protein SOW08_13910 [Lachnospiraceae bacterium]|nr:hypothetical protein [Lachnospiraceae bacterium]